MDAERRRDSAAEPDARSRPARRPEHPWQRGVSRRDRDEESQCPRVQRRGRRPDRRRRRVCGGGRLGDGPALALAGGWSFRQRCRSTGMLLPRCASIATLAQGRRGVDRIELWGGLTIRHVLTLHTFCPYTAKRTPPT